MARSSQRRWKHRRRSSRAGSLRKWRRWRRGEWRRTWQQWRGRRRILDFNEPNARINGDDGESGGTGDDGGGTGASGGTGGYGFGPDAPDLVFVRGGRKRKIRNSTDAAMISYLYRGIGYRRGLGCCGLRPSPALAIAYRWLPLRNEAWRTC
jgi:hypothetical protein